MIEYRDPNKRNAPSGAATSDRATVETTFFPDYITIPKEEYTNFIRCMNIHDITVDILISGMSNYTLIEALRAIYGLPIKDGENAES